MNLHKQNVLIIGASRGIGHATAKAIIEAGGQVAATYHSTPEGLDDLKKLAQQKELKFLELKTDATQVDSVRQTIQKAKSELGSLNAIVFVTAGKIISKPTAEIIEEDYNGMFNVVRSTFFALQEGIKHLEKNGRIICFSTGGTQMAMPTQGAYTGGKAAIERFCLALSKEVGEHGIRVNCIAPGVTDTDGLTISEEMIEQLKSQTPLGRLGKPKDIASVIVFLLSEEAGWINGQIINVNGGIL